MNDQFKKLLTALITGEELQYKATNSNRWYTIDLADALIRLSYCTKSDNLEDCMRVKPNVIMIGSHEVPEPLRVAPKMGGLYYVALTCGVLEDQHWVNNPSERSWLNNGICHTTKAAAHIHYEALISFTKA